MFYRGKCFELLSLSCKVIRQCVCDVRAMLQNYILNFCWVHWGIPVQTGYSTFPGGDTQEWIPLLMLHRNLYKVVGRWENGKLFFAVWLIDDIVTVVPLDN